MERHYLSRSGRCWYAAPYDCCLRCYERRSKVIMEINRRLRLSVDGSRSEEQDPDRTVKEKASGDCGH